MSDSSTAVAVINKSTSPTRLNIVLEIPTDILISILRYWLSLRDVAKLDDAMISYSTRSVWLATLQRRVVTQSTVNIREKELLKLLWLSQRQAYCVKLAFRGCKLRDVSFPTQHWQGLSKNLTCLRFKDRCSVATPFMMELITACPFLEELMIHAKTVPAFDGTCLRRLADHNPQLTSFFLLDAQDIHTVDWLYFAERCTNLHELNLENSTIAVCAIPKLLTNLKKLNKLTLKRCSVWELSSYAPPTIPVLVQTDDCACPKGETLLKMTHRELIEFLEQESSKIATTKFHSSLYSIDISYSKVLAPIVMPFYIRHCPQIERLNVSFCSLVGPLFRLVAQFSRRLRTLFMPGCSIHDDVFVDMVSHCPLLETFVLGYSPHLTQVICKVMASYLHNLKTFALWGNQLAFTKESMETLVTSCKKIDKIALTHTNIDDDTLIVLFENCHISRLEINNCSKISDRCMYALSAHCGAYLTHFVAEYVKLSDIGLMALTLCPLLEYINISGCTDLSNSGLLSLLQCCPKLATLRLKECPWVNDDTLAILSEFGTSLRELDVSANNVITADGILNLIEKSPYLHRLTAINCVHLQLLTEEAAIDRIRAAATHHRTVFLHEPIH